MLNLVLATVFFALCLLAVYKDVTRLIIPNWLNAALALLALPALAFSGLPLATIGITLGVAVVAFVVAVLLFFGRILGGGDAKMIPAVMLWLSPADVPTFLFGMAVAGGVMAAVILPARFAAPAGFASPDRWASLQRGVGVPYAIAIVAGVFYAAPHAPLLAPVFGGFAV